MNSYQKELGVNLLAWLEEKSRQTQTVYWLDMGCGTGKALLEAAALLEKKGIVNVRMEGWDVAGLFMESAKPFPTVQFVADTIAQWQPTHGYDLITSVHGLHYMGDKLGLIQKCVGHLTQEGMFMGNLDLKNLKTLDGRSLDRPLRKMLSGYGIHYHPRRHLLTCQGPRQMNLTLHYAGANDQAGKNYTGQEVVDSYYQ